MKQQLSVFLIRWLLNTFGLWAAIRLFGTGLEPSEVDAGVLGYLLAGLIFSVVNSALRPIIIIFSLPAILLTLGLFTFVVNGFMVYISLALTPGIQIAFWNAILAGIVISLINYIMSSLFELGYEPRRREIS